MIAEIFHVILLTLGGLLPIMNPFSTAPLFLALTADMSESQRSSQALKACIYAFFIIVTFLFIGNVIINFFGISIPGIRIAGGLIIAFIGFRMLFPQPAPIHHAAADAENQVVDVSFTPLAMPSLAGPGTLSVVLSAAGEVREKHSADWLIIFAAIVIGTALTLLIAYVTLRGSTYLVRFLGHSGVDAMTRIFGFLLICIAMQFVLTGIDAFFKITGG